MSAIAQPLATLESIVGAAAVVPWEEAEPRFKSQVAQAVTPETRIAGVVYPETSDALAEVVACAHRNCWRILPCGNGSKLHWGGLAEGVLLVVSTARLQQLIDHASGDLTVTAEAGLRLRDLQETLATAEQFLAVDPAYPEQATLGGIVATADTGGLRQRYGGIRDMLIGISFVRSDGKRAKAGGRVVKNVAGYDLMKLMTGSYGTLGILDQVTFRIYPLPPVSRTVLLTGDTDTIARATATLLASALTPTRVELLAAATMAALDLGTSMGLLCRFQSIEVGVEKQSEQWLQVGQTLALSGTSFREAEEQALWQQLREKIDSRPSLPQVTCKIGVVPSSAVATLSQMADAPLIVGLIHAGSGLGTVQFAADVSAKQLLELRSCCQSHGGFLTILEAPLPLKQQLDVWGYPGNALELMQTIKRQFDPESLFSPHRFVGGM